MKSSLRTLSGLMLIVCLSVAAAPPILAQASLLPNYPEKGRPCPDYALQNIHYFREKQSSVKALKGKWLILDFWNRYCVACIESFPRMSAIQREFRDRLDIIMVGRQDPENKIRLLYDKHRKASGLEMAVSYDSAFYDQMNLPGAPYLIILDDQGIVRALTISVTREDLLALMQGDAPEIARAIRRDQQLEYPYDTVHYLQVNGNGGPDTGFLYRSMLTKWTSGMAIYRPGTIANGAGMNPPKVEILCAELNELYRYAYFGRGTWMPVFDSTKSLMPIYETDDTAIFQNNFAHARNLFNYSLSVPAAKGDRTYFQRLMQNDLKNYFGYTVSLEYRPVPCWKLIATPEARVRLRSLGGQMDWTETATGVRLRNCTVKALLSEIWVYRQEGPNYLDQTGIQGNIDLDLATTFTDLEQVRQALRKNGLDLVWSSQWMIVLVIRK